MTETNDCNCKCISVKLSLFYYGTAFAIIGAVSLISIEKIHANSEFGWLITLALTALFLSPPYLLVPKTIAASKRDFILQFRTGKRIMISKTDITSVDQAWIRFISKGFASHWAGIMYIRNSKEIDKFIKSQIQSRRS